MFHILTYRQLIFSTTELRVEIEPKNGFDGPAL